MICERCGGSGWIAVPDPLIDALIDTRCPECSTTTPALEEHPTP